MPRPRSTTNELNRAKTERWRTKKRIAGIPESSIVDRAIAAAMAACFAHDLDADIDRDLYSRLLKSVLRILTAQGYQRVEASQAIMRRLTRRSDLLDLQQIVFGMPRACDAENG